jgi:hypothetical protein
MNYDDDLKRIMTKDSVDGLADLVKEWWENPVLRRATEARTKKGEELRAILMHLESMIADGLETEDRMRSEKFSWIQEDL